MTASANGERRRGDGHEHEQGPEHERPRAVIGGLDREQRDDRAEDCETARVDEERGARPGRANRLHRRALWRRDRTARLLYQPRVSSSSSGRSVAAERPLIASPRPREMRARISASSKCVVASTIAFARVDGSADLKIPEPTKTPSAPSCMQSAASAGVAMPPAVNVTTGSLPFSATHLTSSYGARSSFASA